MKTTEFFNINKYTVRIALALCGLLAYQNVMAKRQVVVQAEPAKTPPPALILNLPAENAMNNEEPAWAKPSLTPSLNSNDANQLVAERKKKAPIVNCGMDMYQNTGPDIPLTSRLTGECDLKLHY
jgi:hypothetical protein